MSLFTSENFASAAASGKDWREASKNVLDKLDGLEPKDKKRFNFGFLYISDYLADDANSILNLFRSVLEIENWIGCVGMGVIGTGESFVDKPAIAAMIGHMDEDGFCIFPQISEDRAHSDQDRVKTWLSSHVPMLTLVHGDPLSEEDPIMMLRELEKSTGAFLIGGLSSSRSHHYQIASAVCENAICGAFFDQSLPVVTTLSQGCEPISDFHTITKAQDNIVFELDGKPALDVFQDTMRALAAKKLGKTPGDFNADLTAIRKSEDIPEEFQSLFKGQVHVAFPLSQSDQKDYLVRNIMGIDADQYALAVSEQVSAGDRMLFVERDQATVAKDLTKNLVSLKERVIAQYGDFNPKAGIYVSCVARGYAPDKVTEETEIRILQDMIGKIPMAGFYAGGEISNARLYGYTGILILFL